jgi:hypothetical protein
VRSADASNPIGFADARRTGANLRLPVLVAIAAAVSFAGTARDARAAAFVLDSGTPAGGSQLILSTSQSFAAEFSIAAGQTVTSLAAFLKPNTGNANSFEFEIFSNSPTFIGSRSPTLEYSDTATVTATSSTPGWNTVAANWKAPTSGDYWLAILEPNTGTTLDVQTETSTTTGTAPALSFASTNTPGTRYATSSSGIGLQITAVPLPAAAWLMLSGLGGLGALGRNRKAA